MERTIIEIDKNKFLDNYKYLKKLSKSEIMFVLKANAYGHGLKQILELVNLTDLKFLAVAFLEDAIFIRSKNKKYEILIFNYVEKEKLKQIIENNLIISIYSFEQMKIYITHLEKDELKKIRFHLKINTGMNRLGLNFDEIDEFIKLLKENEIFPEGIYSHFSSAQSDREYTKFQFENFKKCINSFEEAGIKIKYKHISNSAGAILHREFSLDFVRIGMSIYGLQALKDRRIELEGILTWKSTISSTKKVKKGERISYGTKEIEKDIQIATIPIGYSDGYSFQLSNKAEVLLRGKRFEIIGEVCMDQIIINIGEEKNVKIGEEVVLIGKQGKEEIKAEELAKISGTIADDILAKLNPNIKRLLR